MLSACRLMGAATGIHVQRVNFSDPQGGKGPCDRRAASIKPLEVPGCWEGISSLNNFNYQDGCVTVCKAYDIGQRKTIPWPQLQDNTQTTTVMIFETTINSYSEIVTIFKDKDNS